MDKVAQKMAICKMYHMLTNNQKLLKENFKNTFSEKNSLQIRYLYHSGLYNFIIYITRMVISIGMAIYDLPTNPKYHIQKVFG